MKISVLWLLCDYSITNKPSPFIQNDQGTCPDQTAGSWVGPRGHINNNCVNMSENKNTDKGAFFRVRCAKRVSLFLWLITSAIWVHFQSQFSLMFTYDST